MFEVWQSCFIVLTLLSALANRGAAGPQGSAQTLQCRGFITRLRSWEANTTEMYSAPFNKVEITNSVQCSVLSLLRVDKNSFYNLFMWLHAPSASGSHGTPAGLRMCITVRLNMWLCNWSGERDQKTGEKTVWGFCRAQRHPSSVL